MPIRQRSLQVLGRRIIVLPSTEEVAAREAEELAEERVQKEGEIREAPEIRKSKWIARGKAKVIYPRNQK